MGDEKRVVWVLGAGFSAGLGGPLLGQLFSTQSRDDIRVRYPRNRVDFLHGEEAILVRTLYLEGEGIWRDAEDFIDYLDTAAEARPEHVANPHRDRLAQLLGRQGGDLTLKPVRAAARALIAAECCSFLEAVDVTREQWQPYRAWARALTRNDTVVTFNYDRVLEKLIEAQNSEAQRRVGEPSQLVIVKPGGDGDAMAAKSCPTALKLHGSVDWKKSTITGPNGTKTFIQLAGPLFALDGPDEMVIATPGPSKKREADGCLRELWELAREAIIKADAVVFVGYRFPETDADAREQLLEAIRENGSEARDARPQDLALHIVLGSSRDHAERLASLLRFVCKKSREEERRPKPGGPRHRAPYRFTIDNNPLFAQDFFTVADRDDL